ncbi:Integrase [Salmonella enterica subsp. arizonae]|uniref:Integrase n=1 Tax=Salmonella enterica subsp. arizonae TaxID=59203 RepID=A0A3S5DG51_SALER|nr:Integrase [Salmonella enterica subsp. arizonae]
MKDVKDIFLKYVIKHKSTLVACANRIHTRLDSDYFQIKQSKKCNSTTIGHFYFTISRCARYPFFRRKPELYCQPDGSCKRAVYGAWMADSSSDQIATLNQKLSGFAPSMPHSYQDSMR